MNDSTLSSKARMPDPQKPPNFVKAKRLIKAQKINQTKDMIYITNRQNVNITDAYYLEKILIAKNQTIL